MKIHKRFKDIVKSQVHAKLDKMEDPEKMIRLILAELDETLASAKSSASQRLADKVLLEDEIKQTTSAINRWENRALLAVEKGRDDMAREALTEKVRLTKHLGVLEEQLASLQSMITSMEEQIATLEAKRRELRDKERMIVQRSYHAKEKREIAQTLRKIDAVAVSEKFAQMEEKIDRMEAEAHMEKSAETTESSFAQMERDEEIEAELAKLKGRQTV